MSNNADTKPTLETILQRIDALRENMGAFKAEVNERFDAIDTRFDRVESLAHLARSEMLDMRADFRDLRSALREHLPAPR